MKKTLILRTIVCFAILSLLTVSAFASRSTPEVASDEVINVIKLLEIANGDENGNMNFDKEVTRAEFVKMVINASPYKEDADNIKLNISLFPDVKNSFWGAGYISVAINNGLVNGYIDGTFKPGNAVTLEEAVTIVLRLLGYSNSDLIGSYPSAQLKKYADLELDENISANRGEKLTREECMILLYNSLSATTKQGTKYCTPLGLATNSEGRLDYSALLEDKLSGPFTVTDKNEVINSSDFLENDSTIYMLNNSKVKKDDIRINDIVYYSDVLNAVYAYRKTATGILDSVNGNIVTISGKNYTIVSSTAKDKLSFGGIFSESKSFITLILGINDGVVDVTKGSVDKITENDDNSSIISMIDATISKAIYISSNEKAENWKTLIPFSIDSAEIFFNGMVTASPDVVMHDVIYYSKPFNKVWIYRKSVSGTIEQISSITSPTSVTVSGKTYAVKTSDAAYDLSVYGTYEVGDKVTLLLGINDECIAVADAKTTSGIIYGVVTATGEKQYTDKDGESYTADFVTVTDTAANSYTYEFSNRYLSVGDAVKVAVSDAVSISKLHTEIGRSEAVTLSNAIRSGLFTEDCEIIDVKGSDVIKVKVERIKNTILDVEHFQYSSVVSYYEYDSNGNLTKLILNNFTGDIDEYGVVTAASSGKITYKSGREENNLSTERITCSPGAAKLHVENGVIASASTLTGSIDNIDVITNLAVYDEKGNEYLLSDNIKVFIKTASGYEYSSISDVSTGNYTLAAYYDKLPIYGGRIRVIIASRKV